MSTMPSSRFELATTLGHDLPDLASFTELAAKIGLRADIVPEHLAPEARWEQLLRQVDENPERLALLLVEASALRLLHTSKRESERRFIEEALQQSPRDPVLMTAQDLLLRQERMHRQSPPRMASLPPLLRPLPSNYVTRTEGLSRLTRELLKPAPTKEVRVVALHGPGGFGKTLLATAVLHEPRVRERFPDGIHWVTLGAGGDIAGKLADLYRLITGQAVGVSELEARAEALANALSSGTRLLVLDDVWHETDARWFCRGAPNCVRLVTTRDERALPPDKTLLSVGALNEAESLALLTSALPVDAACEPLLQSLRRRLGGWPLLLSITQSTLARQLKRRSLPETLREVLQALEKRGLSALDDRSATDLRDPEIRARAVNATLKLSLDMLGVEVEPLFRLLGVFPEDEDIPVSTVERLWEHAAGLSMLDTDELLERLTAASLLEQSGKNARGEPIVRLHDVVRSWLGSTLEQHRSLLDAHRPSGGNWAKLPATDHYLWRFLGYHLVGAGEAATLEGLLFGYSYLQRKLEVAGYNALRRRCEESRAGMYSPVRPFPISTLPHRRCVLGAGQGASALG